MNIRKKTVIIIFVTMIICCISILVIIGSGVIHFVEDFSKSGAEIEKSERDLLEKISKRTGTEANWLSIRAYVYCDLLKLGTSRSDVEVGLSKIGEYHDNNLGLTSQITFIEPNTKYALSPIIIYYDKNELVFDSGPGENNFGPRANCEIPND